ncbi:MAG: HNH endonuclease signature motif containing protein [Paraglaciecola polaris]|uniref:HNH endonuclease signature motif containing protein n=1 Tax=Paraglaciecola polaris TaxID=222814 RepID=UPI0030039080
MQKAIWWLLLKPSALTLSNVREILIASHIVPWSNCDSNEQRRDGANGILLCAHIDKLFVAHLLTFVKQGAKFVSKLSLNIDYSLLKRLGIEAGYELCCDHLITYIKIALKNI